MGDLRHGRARGLTFDGNATANRMASVSLNGVQQANYEYNFLGQQVIRRLASGDTIHSVHDIWGNRIAEYDYDDVAGTSTLIREYIWAGDRLVGVWENGSYYAVRTDHIGRPIFATDMAANVVWEASYLPFGGVQASAGPNLNLRFPGQWFQAEAGLHQNWMRDYDPTLGRYLQTDPLGLVDGPSIYGYALLNPGRFTDPRGEQTAEAVIFDPMNNMTEITRGGGGAGWTNSMAAGLILLPVAPTGDGTRGAAQSLPIAGSACGHDCSAIYADIQRRISSLERRFRQWSRNKGGFVPGDPGFYNHANNIFQEQNGLERAVRRAIAMGCYLIDPRAYYYMNRELRFAGRDWGLP